jgi:2-octaprenyl-6-methoxyphenol hydroxylase
VPVISDAVKSFNITPAGIDVITHNGIQITGQLLVGADGRKSTVRTLSKIPVWEHNYHQSALTFLIEHPSPHHNTATEFHRPNGPLALVPLPNHLCSVVWTEPTPEADKIIHLRRGECESLFNQRTQEIYGTAQFASPIQIWPLISLRAQRINAPRVALMAEAAHVLSPLTAQGLNLSISDAVSLADCIIRFSRLGYDAGDLAVLAAYEKRQTHEINARAIGVHMLHQAISTDDPALRYLRRTGLRAVGGLTPLKKLAMDIGLRARPMTKGLRTVIIN